MSQNPHIKFLPKQTFLMSDLFFPFLHSLHLQNIKPGNRFLCDLDILSHLGSHRFLRLICCLESLSAIRHESAVVLKSDDNSANVIEGHGSYQTVTLWLKTATAHFSALKNFHKLHLLSVSSPLCSWDAITLPKNGELEYDLSSPFIWKLDYLKAGVCNFIRLLWIWWAQKVCFGFQLQEDYTNTRGFKELCTFKFLKTLT